MDYKWLLSTLCLCVVFVVCGYGVTERFPPVLWARLSALCYSGAENTRTSHGENTHLFIHTHLQVHLKKLEYRELISKSEMSYILDSLHVK